MRGFSALHSCGSRLPIEAGKTVFVIIDQKKLRIDTNRNGIYDFTVSKDIRIASNL